LRSVRYSVAMSLDGYIAGPNGEIDWLPHDVGLDWVAFMDRFDTMLVGRHTFQLTLSMADAAGHGQLRTYVFSRTLKQDEHPAVTIVSDDAAAVVRALREETGREIWLMGGGLLFGSLLQAGLVDNIEVAIVPVLLGRGIPFLPPIPAMTRLELTDMKQYDGGLLMLSYDVAREQA